MAGGDSLGGLLKDRRVQVGAAVAGGVGLLALLMRSKGGGSSGGSGTIAQPATLNSTGTDVYNAMQSLGQGWQSDLQGFTSQLKNVNDRLSQAPSTGAGAPPWTNWKPEKPGGARQTLQERNKVIAQFDQVPGASMYAFRLSRPDIPNSMSGAYFNVDPSYAFDNLTPGVNYQVQAQAITPGGLSAPTVLQTWTGK